MGSVHGGSLRVVSKRLVAVGLPLLLAAVSSLTWSVGAGAATSGSITSVAPTVRKAGDQAVVTGTGFTKVSSVKFKGAAAKYTVVSSTKITATVPAAATTGVLTVTTAAATLTSPRPLVVAPTLTGFTPTSGGVHTVITVTGTGFTAPATVSINGVPTAGTVVSATKITAPVPAAATTGALKVTTAGSTLTGSTFTVTTGIALSAAVGPPTSSISIYGTGFGSGEAVDLYAGTTDIALVSTNSAGSFTATGFTIPTTAQPGTLQITAIGRHSGLAAQALYTVRTDWAQYQGGPNHPGVNSYENTLSSANVSTLDTKWTFATSTASNTTPAEVGGVIYTSDGNGNVYAVNAGTGVQVWTRALGNAIQSSPAVVGSTLYLGSENNTFYALNTATGATRWSHVTGGPIYSSPAVVNGVVYFGSYDDYVYALNATTGAQVWSYNTGNPVYAAPAVAGNRVFIGNIGGVFSALNATTGAVLWSAPAISGSINDSASVVAGTVYVGGDDDVMRAYAAASGSQRWAFTAGGPIGSTPTVANNTVYFGAVDDKLYAVNVATGTLNWSYLANGVVNASPVVANGIVYIGTYVGSVYALYASYGGVLWLGTVGGLIYGSPIVTNGRVVVSADALYDFEPALTPNGANAVPKISRLRPDRRLLISGNA